ncbi:hypothetical protein MYX06_03300 [Patescibacteria group bacterium AH-259-L05]|nr:hypothetical protein [Patescibacteria group bacterium AH-259-L05]
MKNVEQPNVSPFTEEDQRRIEERERKKQVKRENRLKTIVENNLELLRSLFPEEADNFEITYEEIHERHESIFKETVQIPFSQSPAYGIFLSLKSNPEKKYEIMHWFRPDLDAQKAEFDLLLRQSFADRIKEGVEELKTED